MTKSLITKNVAFIFLVINVVGCVDLEKRSGFSDNEAKTTNETNVTSNGKDKFFRPPKPGMVVLNSYSTIDTQSFVTENANASYFVIEGENMTVILDYDELVDNPEVKIMANPTKKLHKVYAYDNSGQIIGETEL